MTPLAAPLLMEMGRERVGGDADDRLLEAEAEALLAESAMD
jgi:hypothetical protein